MTTTLLETPRTQLEKEIIQKFVRIDEIDLRHIKNILSIVEKRPRHQRQQISSELQNFTVKLNAICEK